ncbi:MAG: bis-aminopropyl spermidine synthase family protein [Thermovirgaceae bacterium]
MELKDIAENVSKETGIPLCGRDVERVAAALLRTPDFWHIIEYSEEPVPVVASTLRIFEQRGLAEVQNDGVFLTPEGARAFQKTGIWPVVAHLCPRCKGRTVVKDAFTEALRRFESIHGKRPPALRVFDQAYVTPETTFARIALADSHGDIRGKDILVLGDDDLMGLGLAFTQLPKSVTVIEIDERLIEFEREEASRAGIKTLKAAKHDLRKPLPESLIDSFDVFFCDPPETVAAFDAFIGRGALSLKGPGGAGYFGLTSAESSFAKWKILQEGLLARGFVLTDLIRGFNEYVNWDYAEDMRAWEMAPVKNPPGRNWYRSAMFRVELVRKGRIPNTDLTDSEIYNDRESSTV